MTFVETVLQDSVRALTSNCKQALIWGLTADCTEIVAGLARAGFLHAVVGIAVPDGYEGPSPFNVPLVPESRVNTIEFDLLIVATDDAKEDALRRFVTLDQRLPAVIARGSAHYAFRDPDFEQLVQSLPVRSKAGGYPNMLLHIFQCLRSIAMRRLKGVVVELGVFNGGTTVFMARALQRFGYPLPIIGFDTFSGFPARRSAFDLFADRSYTVADYEVVRAYCAPYPIELVQGDIATVAAEKLRDTQLVFTFVDTDNYSAVRAVLPQVWDQTVVGGFIAFDHYFSPTWDLTVGERMAADEVLGERPDAFNLHGSGIFVKLPCA